MKPQHATPFAQILADRQMTNRALASAIDTTEANVSKIRNGLRPGKNLQDRICDKLKLSDEEMVALGWNTTKEKAEA